MSFLSLIISLCLHASLILLLVFWPSSPPVKLEGAPIQISLMEGAPGGNRTPSPVLGPQAAPGPDKPAPSLPAPKADVTGPETERQAVPVIEPKSEARKAEVKPEPKPEPKPEQKPEPKIEQKAEVKPEPKPEQKPEKKQPEQEKKPAPKKEDPKDHKKEDSKKKKPDAKKEKKQTGNDAVAAALRKAQKHAGSQARAPQTGSATERALAEAKRRAGGHNGGGGGEGDGVGGGGLLDVYLGQVMLAVRPNWGYASASRNNLSCLVHVTLGADGAVQSAELTRSSGNAQFDASAVNAVHRTGANRQFPPPPNREYQELDLVFNLNDLR